jgi:choline-sulfatase
MRRSVLLVGGVGLFCLTASCNRPPRPVDRILLVTIDTLRADHVGYAGHDVETPNLDALAASGAAFTDAVSAAPLTLPSHATILSGLYPTHHGTRNNGTFHLPAEVSTVAERLKPAGYRTAAFVGAFVLERRFGLDQGFDLYDDDLPEENPVHKAYYPERRAEVVVSRALEWIHTHENEKFFLWVHVYDPHMPNNAPSPYAERYPDSPYDAEIAYTDAALGPLFDAVRAGDGGSRSAILVTADHGESLTEHGESTHGLFVYDATMRVPLVLDAPGVAPGRRVERQVRTVDIAPTLLELGGVEPEPPLDGVSLFRVLEDENAAPKTAYGESFVPRFNFNWSELRFLRTDRYKLIDAPRKELYDLKADPGELTNLWSESPPPEARALLRQLQSLEAAEPAGAGQTMELDEETARRLKSLGYMSQTAPQTRGAQASELADPKDRVDVYERFQTLLAATDLTPAETLAAYREILKLEPGNTLARKMIASLLAEEGRYDEAIAAFRELLLTSEVDSKGLENLSVALLIQNRVDEAISVTQSAVARSPWDPDLHVLAGEALERGNRLDDALRAYAKAVQIEPNDAKNYWRRGAVLVKLGERDRAEEDFRHALEVDPRLEPARLALARSLAQAGRPGEARRVLDEAPETAGAKRSPDWKAGLAEAELAEGNPAGALALLEEARAEAPENTRVLALLGPIYGEKGDFAKAAATLEKAISLGEKGPEVRRNLGLAYLRQGKVSNAIDALRAATEEAPRDAALWFGLGNAYLRAGRSREAVDALKRSVELDPTRDEALFNLGLAYDQAGDKASSAATYRRFLASGASDPARRAAAESRIRTLELGR